MVSKSILATVRVYLGYLDDEEAFDTELIPIINTALTALKRVGIGEKGFILQDVSSTWLDFLGAMETDEDVLKISAISYVEMRVKMLFDPSSSATVMNALDDACKEILWELELLSEVIE